MKKITKERLLKAIEHSQAILERNVADVQPFITQATTAGLHMMVDDAMGKDSSQNPKVRQLGLECDYAGIPQSHRYLTLSEMQSYFFSEVNRHHTRCDRIREIQVAHNISGLEYAKIKLGEGWFAMHVPSEDLALLDRDLEEENGWKQKAIQEWLTYTMSWGLDFYVNVTGSEDSFYKWQKIDDIQERLLAAIPFYCRATVWEDVSYSSPSKMRKQGFDSIRSQPILPDDQKQWEVHLELTSGKDQDDIDTPRLWFCACNRMPTG